MSLFDVRVQQFSDMFVNVFQQRIFRLDNTTQVRRGVVGSIFHEKVAGQVLLHDRGAYQSDISPSDVSYTDVQLTFNDRVALFPTDIFEQATVNANEQMNLAKQSAMAIARREDQIVINALEATTTTPIAAGGTNLTVDKLLEAKLALDAANVPPEDRFFVMHANQARSLLQETQVSNANYNTSRVLANGMIDTFLGFKFITFGDMLEGGLPLAAGIRTNFAFQMDAVLMAYGQFTGMSNPGINIDWDPRRQSHLVIPRLRAGAKVILDNGVVPVLCDES